MAKSKKKAGEEKPQEPLELHAVLYTDGGSRPTNPGFCGSGIHGYVYSTEPPKKGSGNPTQVLTADGYMPKSEKASVTEVTPIGYLDIGVSYRLIGTNNIAELGGAEYAFIAIRDMIKAGSLIKSVLLHADSKYVVDGYTKYYRNWVRNNWIKSDGTEVRNPVEWKRLGAIIAEVESLGCKVKIGWIKAHSGLFGNERADGEATAAIYRSMRWMTQGAITPEQVQDRVGGLLTEDGNRLVNARFDSAEGFWKSSVTKHPFIGLAVMFFDTNPEFRRPGHYDFGSRTKDFEDSGKRNGSECFAIVQLPEGKVEPLLEFIIDRQLETSDGGHDFYVAHLQRLFNPDMVASLERWGVDAVQPLRTHLKDLCGLTLVETVSDDDTAKKADVPVTRHLNPPRLAFRTSGLYDDLETKLDLFKERTENSKELVVTDVTDTFYETKPGKKETDPSIKTLRPEFTSGLPSMEIKVKYDLGSGQEEANITVTFGIDIPDRNMLKRAEILAPTVYIVTWRESEYGFRHATIITGEDGSIGIWCGYFSNLRIIGADKTQPTGKKK